MMILAPSALLWSVADDLLRGCGGSCRYGYDVGRAALVRAAATDCDG